jgi:hypothetical protein
MLDERTLDWRESAAPPVGSAPIHLRPLRVMLVAALVIGGMVFAVAPASARQLHYSQWYDSRTACIKAQNSSNATITRSCHDWFPCGDGPNGRCDSSGYYRFQYSTDGV